MTGVVLPVARVVAMAHAAGARVVLDAAQLAPHRRVPDVLGAAALARACRTLGPVLDGPGPDHERELLHRLGAGLARVPGVTCLRIWATVLTTSTGSPAMSPRTCPPNDWGTAPEPALRAAAADLIML